TCMDPAVRFTDLSTDPDGAIAIWTWDFGDGSPTVTGTSPTVAPHEYAVAGTYTVTLTVTDGTGLTNTASLSVVSIGHPNCPVELAPIGDRTIRAGRDVHVCFSARDADDPLETLTWEVTGLPPGATFDPSGPCVTWFTGVGDAGLYEGITVTVRDEASFATQVLRITVLPQPPGWPAHDVDMDGVDDFSDDCPSVPDPAQADGDHDGLGDACDAAPTVPDAPPTFHPLPAGTPDRDEDGVADALDGCPGIPDAAQSDRDGDRVGDACDPDLDGDGVVQSGDDAAAFDNCPLVSNLDQADADGDGVGDACSGRAGLCATAAATESCRARPNGVGAAAPVHSSAPTLVVAVLVLAAVFATLVIAVARRSGRNQ
ncbi:MAG: thrombospondin type 3 repeat-containing protein, partial [Halobacteriales archaeon]|nr:thrombospondin type 3 repeat-containing protein [Halobacteriales archaeon]